MNVWIKTSRFARLALRVPVIITGFTQAYACKTPEVSRLQ